MEQRRCETILIIEDDEDVRDTLQEWLQAEGYDAFSVSNGKEGFAALKAIRKPCLVLLDLMMPVMNGWELLNEMMSDVVLTSLPVVVLSAMKEPVAFGGERISKSMTQLLKKPVDIEALLKIVENHCGRASRNYLNSSTESLLSNSL